MYHILQNDTIDKLLTLPGTTVKIYLAILHHRGINTEECFPGYQTIGRLSGVTSGARIKTAVDALIELHLLERWENNGQFYYRVI